MRKVENKSCCFCSGRETNVACCARGTAGQKEEEEKKRFVSFTYLFIYIRTRKLAQTLFLQGLWTLK